MAKQHRKTIRWLLLIGSALAVGGVLGSLAAGI